MNDIKKAALVEEGQPADLTAQRKATEAYHDDGNLSNEANISPEVRGWLDTMVAASKGYKLNNDIMVALLGGGVHMTGIKKLAEKIGVALTVDKTTYIRAGLVEASFVYDGVTFYELFENATYEEG